MSKEFVEQTISNISVYLQVHKRIYSDMFDLKCAVEAVAKLFEYRDLESKAGYVKPEMTESEAVERMLETFQHYKLVLNAKSVVSSK